MKRKHSGLRSRPKVASLLLTLPFWLPVALLIVGWRETQAGDLFRVLPKAIRYIFTGKEP